MKEEIQAFATGAGELSYAWQIEFGDRQEHHEVHPCLSHVEDGSIQESTITTTVEVSSVAFRTNADAIQPGSVGQLSTTGDIFYQVTVKKVFPSDGFDEVVGEARRTLDYGINPP